MANGNTEDRRGWWVEYLDDHAPAGLSLDGLRAHCEKTVRVPTLQTLRKRRAIKKAARAILGAGVEGLPPTLAALVIDYERHTPEEDKGMDFLYVLTSIANHRPTFRETALARYCPDKRARFAVGVADYCQRWNVPQLAPRVVLAAAIAWGVEHAPPAKRESALVRAWEGRVAKARKLAAKIRDRMCSTAEADFYA